MFEVRNKEEEVLMCLQQEDRRMRRKEGGGENLPIGFEVLKVSQQRRSYSLFTISKNTLFCLVAPRWR